MKAQIKNESYILISNRYFMISFLFLTGFVIIHFIFDILPVTAHILGGEYPETVFRYWIGLDGGSGFSLSFFMVVVGIASFPIGMIYVAERETGYLNQQILRTGRWRTAGTKYISFRLVSGFLVVWPLVLDYYLASMFLPSVSPIASTFLYPLEGKGLLTTLFYTKPTIYVFIRILMAGILSSSFTVMVIPAFRVIPNIYLAGLFPYALFLGLHFTAAFIGGYEWSPFNLLYPANGNGVGLHCWFCLEGALVLLGIFGTWREVKQYEM